MTAVVPASTYLPIAMGAVIAGAACLLFIYNVHPSREEGQKEDVLTDDLRQLAIRVVCCVYSLLGGAFFAVALALGGIGFIFASGAVFVASVCAALSLWSADGFVNRAIFSKAGQPKTRGPVEKNQAGEKR